jgi:hypothetical protein
MVPEPTSTPAVETPSGDGGSDTLIHALVGAVAGIVLSFVPLSPLLGGTVAGFLEGGEPNDWVKVGGLAGVIMLVPFVLVGTALLFFLGFGMGRSAVGFGILAVVMLFVGAIYTVGLSVAGGYLGGYLEGAR